MQVVPNRNEFLQGKKLAVQKCTRMYIFDEMVAVSFNTLCYDVERCRERQVLNRTNKKTFMMKEKQGEYKNHGRWYKIFFNALC